VADDRHVTTLAFHVGLAQRYDVLSLRHLALGVVEHLAFDEDHRVVVPDGALEQTLRVGWRGRHDDLESRNVGVPALERLGVLRGQLQGSSARSAEHRRYPDLAVGHVAHLGGRVDQLVHREEREIPGHELDDRPEAHHGGPDPDAGKPQLGDRCVHHPHGAELIEQPAADLVGALIDSDLLAHQEHVRVPLHLLAKCLVQGIAVRNDGHQLLVLSPRAERGGQSVVSAPSLRSG
jgi:hypothetical protein